MQLGCVRFILNSKQSLTLFVKDVLCVQYTVFAPFKSLSSLWRKT